MSSLNSLLRLEGSSTSAMCVAFTILSMASVACMGLALIGCVFGCRNCIGVHDARTDGRKVSYRSALQIRNNIPIPFFGQAALAVKENRRNDAPIGLHRYLLGFFAVLK